MTEPARPGVPALHAVLDGIGRSAVAVSGGVDSMTLALLAGRRLGAACAMFHAVSPAVPPEATARVRALGAREGWRLTVLDAGEFDDPAYRANPANRCFYCKTNLYGALAARTDATLLSGTNLDDLGDWRPGLKAAEEHGVRHPFVEAGIDKARIRAIAAALGFDDLARLPAAPCLSSRIETGLRVEADDLASIHAAERYLARQLRQLRPETVRCRRRRAGIVIELDAPTLDALTEGRRDALGTAVAGMFDAGRRRRPRPAGPLRALPGRQRLPETCSRRVSTPTAITLDLERCARIGIEEAVLCAGKTPEQLADILRRADEADASLLLTRLDATQRDALPAALAERIDYEPLSRTGFFGTVAAPAGAPRVAIVSAGTSDQPVSREAARTLAYHGHPSAEIGDVGVAGLWRLMEQDRRDQGLPGRHRGGRHGRRAPLGGRRPRAGAGDRGADLHRLRHRPGRGHRAHDHARLVRAGDCGGQHRQRLRRRLRRAAGASAARRAHTLKAPGAMRRRFAAIRRMG